MDYISKLMVDQFWYLYTSINSLFIFIVTYSNLGQNHIILEAVNGLFYNLCLSFVEVLELPFLLRITLINFD